MIRVVLPVPNESKEVWEIFKPHIQQFIATWLQFPPGVECELVPVLSGDDFTGEVTDLFIGLPVDQFVDYRNGGADIGASQFVAQDSQDDDFIVAMTSRVYFHRAGWLNHLAIAREIYGPGLYGCFASMEGGRLHLCTRCYSMDAFMWKQYPEIITSRDQGTFFEVGADNPNGNLLEWAESKGWPGLLVYWDGVRRREHFLTPANIFRTGNQENCLVFDKHTEAWFRADDEERERLSSLCFGVDLQAGKA